MSEKRKFKKTPYTEADGAKIQDCFKDLVNRSRFEYLVQRWTYEDESLPVDDFF